MAYKDTSDSVWDRSPDYEKFYFTVFGRQVHIVQILGLLSVFVAWELVPRITPVSTQLMPSLVIIFSDSLVGFSTFYSGTSLQNPLMQAFFVLAWHSAWTAFRFFIGVLSGLLFGFVLGLSLSWNQFVRNVFEPVITIARTVPLLALIPLFILWFGTSEIGKYVYVTYAITVIFTVNTLEAATNLSDRYTEFASSLGASKLLTYRTVIIPGIVPELVGGTRVIFGMGWAVVLAAEFIGGNTGLGWLLIRAQQLFFPGRIFIILLIFMLFTILVNSAFVLVARRMTAWTE
jgi:sulfonate transport system permease protein